MKTKKTLSLIMIILIIFISQLQVKAEQKIKKLTTPLSIQLNQELNLDRTKKGDEIHLIVPEDIVYKDLTLTKGTILIGNVVNTKQTKRHRKYGYFEILVNAILCPKIEQITLKNPIDIKIYEQEIMNRKNKPTWMKTTDAIMFCADNIIPGPGLPYYIYEVFAWDKNMKTKSKRYKWGIVLVKTTTTYYWADFFKKHKDPNYIKDEIVNIKFKKKNANELFSSSYL